MSDRTPKRRWFRFSLRTLFVGMLLIAFGLAVWWSLQNRLVVANESGQTVTLLMITVGGEDLRFEDIPSGKVFSSRFPIDGDGNFVVRGELADGTQINAEHGYVTSGMYGERDTFVIQPGGVVRFSEGRLQK